MFFMYILRPNIIISSTKSLCWKRLSFFYAERGASDIIKKFLRLSFYLSSRNIHLIPPLNYAAVHTNKGWKLLARTGQKKDESVQDEAPVSCEEGTDAVPHLLLLNQLQKCSNVSQQLETFCSHMSLTHDDMERRKQFCNSLTEALSLYFSKVQIHQFGSSCNGLGFKGCDIDVSIQTIFDDKEHLKDIKAVPTLESVSEGITSAETLAYLPPNFLLRFVRRVLRKHCSDIQEPILLIKARCPILRFYSAKYDVFCDFSIVNTSSLRNTKLIYLICHLDERFSKIAKFIRYWGKYGGFVGDMDLFNSYAFSLLIIHFLQQTQPPVLPPIKDLVEKSDYLMYGDVGDYALLYEDLKKFEPSKNVQTAEELLREYFFYFLNFDYSYMMIPLTSTIMPKVNFTPPKVEGSTGAFEFSTVCTQDPFQPNRNTTASGMYKCCRKFLNGLLLACKAYHDKTLWTPKSHEWGISSLFHKCMSENEIFKEHHKDCHHTIKLPLKNDISIVKDIFEKGLLFRCTEMVVTDESKHFQPSLKLHCKVNYNTWQGRDWFRRKCPESLTNPLEIENWISTEILQSKGEIRKNVILFSFTCEIYKNTCDNELTVVLTFSESKSNLIVAEFLKEFIPLMYNKLVS